MGLKEVLDMENDRPASPDEEKMMIIIMVLFFVTIYLFLIYMTIREMITW